MHLGPAQLLGCDLLACRRFHERRAAEEDRRGSAHDHGFVAHRRYVGAAGRAGAHHRRDLRDPRRGHRRLVEEDPSEVIPVGEHFSLHGEVCAAGVDEVDTGKPVLQRHLLCPQMFLHGQREVRPALHGGVVRDDHALPTLDDADACDDPCGRGLAPVAVPGRKRRELEERATGIDEPVDALSREELSRGHGASPRPRLDHRPRRQPFVRGARQTSPCIAARRSPKAGLLRSTYVSRIVMAPESLQSQTGR